MLQTMSIEETIITPNGKYKDTSQQYVKPNRIQNKSLQSILQYGECYVVTGV